MFVKLHEAKSATHQCESLPAWADVPNMHTPTPSPPALALVTQGQWGRQTDCGVLPKSQNITHYKFRLLVPLIKAILDKSDSPPVKHCVSTDRSWKRCSMILALKMCIFSLSDWYGTLNLSRYGKANKIKWILSPFWSFHLEFAYHLILKEKLLDVKTQQISNEWPREEQLSCEEPKAQLLWGMSKGTGAS